jgi:penicillin G amidase
MKSRAAEAAFIAALFATLSVGDPPDLRRRAEAALAQINGEIALAGLQRPVEVIRDRWGVPHVYAQTVDDLFFAQGFVAAQDRLWQMEIWRRTAEGRLAEVAGPDYVDRDTLARLLQYRGDMDAEWRSYAPDARRLIEAFVRGVNAQITHVLADPARLPIEFQLAGFGPEPWTPSTVLGRMAGYIMTRNVRSEVQRARLAVRVGLERVPSLMALDPPVPLTLSDGLDLADFTDDVLRLTTGVDAPVQWPGVDTESSNPKDDEPGAGDAGSNNWVISGARSATGRPLLANDPHRTIQLPSLRYTIHLNGPGWNVIGAGEPALPGVAAGHNDRVAFGFTIVGIDQQDLYVERLHPNDNEQYWYRGGWERMQVERTTIAIRQDTPRAVDLRFTRHGPVIYTDKARRRAFALRWVGLEPGTAGYLASLSLNTARNWTEFLSAVERWKVPSENLAYADVDGNIGWVAAGLAPVRRGWAGLLPVPGADGKFEWDGFLPARELPQLFNPASGFITRANHNILPDGYTHSLGYEFSSPHRFGRIVELLRDAGKLSVADFERMQHDEQSLPARALVHALREFYAASDPPEPDARAAFRMLVGWDFVLSKYSSAAVLYRAWTERLAVALGREVQGAPASVDAVLDLLAPEALTTPNGCWVDGSPRKPSERRTPLFPPDRARTLKQAILTGPLLGDAWRETVRQQGPDPAKWSWGRSHRAVFDHALATTPERRAVMNLADVPRGGDGTTVNATAGGERQTNGASFREIVDVSDWDRSVMINVPGNSAQPLSPHYGDLLPLWADGRYHPMLFSRAAVTRHATARLVLRPAS